MHSPFKKLVGVALCKAILQLKGLAAERVIEPPPSWALRVPASRIDHSVLDSMTLNLNKGIGPDEAAVMAVALNPTLRAARARRGLATAQLIQAGVLPNPQVSYTNEKVTDHTPDTVSAYSSGASWEITSLLPLFPKLTAARANARSVDLDIAWEEWQAAENARLAVYRVAALTAQLSSARDADRALQDNANTLRKAVDAHEKTVLDLAAAEASSEEAHAIALELEQDFDKQWLVLKKALGVPPEQRLSLLSGLNLPSRLSVPSEEELGADLETHRLDLLALQQGCASQAAAVHAAILAAFPKISLGFSKVRDTSDVHTNAFSVTVDLPFFDGNQGGIDTERATRQKLIDEYHSRVFDAHSDIATAVSDIRSLNRQIAAAERALPLLERLVSTAQTAGEQRNADVLGYYTARSSLIQKRIQLLKLKQQLMETKTALEIASGRFLPAPAAR